MPSQDRENLVGAIEDGTWKVGFSESQLGWAALLANGKPPGMDIGSEPSQLPSIYTRTRLTSDRIYRPYFERSKIKT